MSAGGESLTAGGKREKSRSMGLVSVAAVQWHDTTDRLTQYSLRTLFIYVSFLIGHILVGISCPK